MAYKQVSAEEINKISCMSDTQQQLLSKSIYNIFNVSLIIIELIALQKRETSSTTPNITQHPYTHVPNEQSVIYAYLYIYISCLFIAEPQPDSSKVQCLRESSYSNYLLAQINTLKTCVMFWLFVTLLYCAPLNHMPLTSNCHVQPSLSLQYSFRHALKKNEL